MSGATALWPTTTSAGHRRALHDGVQHSWSRLGPPAGCAALAETDPEAAVGLLDDLRSEVGRRSTRSGRSRARSSVAARDARPDGALRGAASAAPLATRVEGTVGVGVPPEVAAAVYRCW